MSITVTMRQCRSIGIKVYANYHISSHRRNLIASTSYHLRTLTTTMLNIDIPGSCPYSLHHLVLDYNGTLALDGSCLPGIFERLDRLSHDLEVHVITADTHGTARTMLADLEIHIQVIAPDFQDEQKAQYVHTLGKNHVVAMGNGRNDAKMLAAAILGVGLLQKEGCATVAMQSADIVLTDIRDALDLLLYPDRLRATLRN